MPGVLVFLSSFEGPVFVCVVSFALNWPVSGVASH